jgi:AraC-like DNA-binding protein
VEAGPGDFICVNPGEVHDGQAIGRRARTWRILYFDPAVMYDARADVLDGAATDSTFAEPVFADLTMRTAFESTFAFAASTSRSADMACETAVLNFVARLCAHFTSGRCDELAFSPSIRRARARVDDDPAARLTLAQLAREAGLSRYQLIRGFARELRQTPHAYILQRRIALARRLIRSGRELAEVAAVAGFYDQSHLTRCFTRQFGVTPKRYLHFCPRPTARPAALSPP